MRRLFPSALPRPGALTMLCAGTLLGLLAGCASTPTVPSDSRLPGEWRIDRGASDDPDAIVARAVHEAEARFRRRLAKQGGERGEQESKGGGGEAGEAGEAGEGGGAGGGESIGGSDFIGPDFHELRQKLRQALLPPRTLRIAIASDAITIGHDQLPPREYPIGEKVSRIDEYGTSVITPKFEHQQLEIRFNYTSRARRVDSYSVTPGGTLSVTEQLNDPTAGKLIVHSVYRRS